MKINITKLELESAVRRVSAAIIEKTALPIYTNIKVATPDDGHLVLTGGDSDLTMSVIIAAQVEGLGEFCVHAQSLREQLQPISEQLLTIDVAEESGTMTIIHANGTCVLPVLSADTYPAPPHEDITSSATFGGAQLAESIKRASWATEVVEIRLQLTGVCIHLGAERADIVGTNGKVLMRNTVSITHDGCTDSEHILPRRAARIVSDMAAASDEITLQFGPKRGVIEQGDARLSYVLIDGNYPNYNAVIPTEHITDVTASPADIIASLRRCMPSLDRSLMRVVLRTEEEHISLRGFDEATGKECRDHFPAECHGEPVTIGVSAATLIQVMQNIAGDSVALENNGDVRPLVIRPTADPTGVETVGIVMPMRIE